jgi:hypothetical protein
VTPYAQFFLPREVRWSWQTFGMHSDELELLLLDQCVPIQATGCWEWSSARFDSGYGRVWISGAWHYAHRVSQELWNGPLTPSRPHALHGCDNPPCINPEHLRAGTPQDNADDRAARGRTQSRDRLEPLPPNWATEPAPVHHRTRKFRIDRDKVYALRVGGLTQVEIAELVGASQAQVSNILRGLGREVSP